MQLHDPALPAVEHLTGTGARDVIGAAVAAAGGALHELRTSQVQYRPGTDLVVRYRADVTWADGRRRDAETLLAAAHPAGALPGTVPVEAEVHGSSIVASVWRWPFDPVVVGLEAAVTPGRTDHLVGDVVGPAAAVEVVAYRPTERAVVRVTGATGAVVYLKAVAPAALAALVDRHRVLRGAGLPVPEVLAIDEAAGLAVLAELAGTTMRQRIKQALPGWGDLGQLVSILDRLHAVEPTGPSGRASRTSDGRGHAALLATLVPELEPTLEALATRFAAAEPAVEARRGATVHGDLHEGQVIVDPDGTISGILDIDDVGAGDPLDDAAVLAGHLRFRAAVLDDDAPPGLRARIADHARQVEATAAQRHGREATDIAVAAVLVGLATGPFRIQRVGWESTIAATVADAAALAGVADVDMSAFSPPAHARLTAGAQGGNRRATDPR